MGQDVRVVVVLHTPPGARALLGLRRALGLGLADVRSRVGVPLVDVRPFGRDHAEVARHLEHLLTVLPATDHTIHTCHGDDGPTEGNRVAAEDVHALLRPDPPPSDGTPAGGDPVLTAAIAVATRRAVERLRAGHPGPFCVFALVTTGEALRPYLGVTLDGPQRWDLADSPLAICGDEHLAGVEPLYAERGELHDMAPEDAEREYGLRLASMEAALRLLDGEGVFGTGQARERVLLLVATMPPDESDAGFARRLIPPGLLLTAWLEEASEGYAATTS